MMRVGMKSFSTHHPLLAWDPGIAYYIRKIKNLEYFSFAKLNHAPWQILMQEEPFYTSSLKHDGPEIVHDLVDILKNIPEEIILAVSPYGHINRIPSKYPKKLLQTIVNYLPKDYVPHNAGIWKESCINGKILQFFDAIRKQDLSVVFVGMKHLSNLGDALHFKSSEFIEIDSDAIQHKQLLCDTIMNRRQENPTIYLLQCGDLLSTWLINKVYQKPQSFFIDMGRVLDIWCTEMPVLVKEGWIIREKSNRNRRPWESEISKKMKKKLLGGS